ncbi:aldo/keto reductase [Luxibacter massiliensis]|uniref:aldo/keto reductase n=1 Tax=Luxibacter massiliensis TaxID=2219695 RepID=UPI000F0705C4|nr:aldo/keto reductase [Luxibacter massiliensis]
MKHIILENKYNKVKASGVIYGPGEAGGLLDKMTSYQFMDYYVYRGGDTIDTARVYGSWYMAGRALSEEMVGSWMKSRGNRGQIILSTKGAHPPMDNMYSPRVNAKEIRKDLEGSLKDLETEYVDIYWLHRDDIHKPVSEIMPVLDSFVKEGKVRALGASNWTHKRIEEANRFAEENGLTPFSGSQMCWALAKYRLMPHDDTEVQMTKEAYDWYLANKMPVFAFTSQAQGLFRKAAAAGGSLEAMEDERFTHFFEKDITNKHIRAVQALAEKYNVSPSTVNLAYFHSNKLPAAALFSASRLSQMEDTLADTDMLLTDEDMRLFEW